MRDVLMSIQPQWNMPIIEGIKKIVARKDKPTVATPFKCLIYCTQNELFVKLNNTNKFCIAKKSLKKSHFEKRGDTIFSGKVIGEFICDKIYDIIPHRDIPTFVNQYMFGWKENEGNTCLSFEELHKYLNGKKSYGWHISDLIIYDKPKELSEFKNLKGEQLKRPFQSWGYVQELEKETRTQNSKRRQI